MRPVTDPLAKPTEASLATARLRAEIVGGVMRPGDKLKLEPLARRYAVSRGPLREAASRLAAEGLVTIEDHRGFRVAPLSRVDLADVTATRQRIEVLALEDAIAHGDLAWEGRVKAACHMLDRVTGHLEDRAAFAAQHQAFHEALVSACPSAYLLEFRARLYALTERYRNLAAEGYAAGRAHRDVAAEHQALADAAVARDAPRAAALLRAHLAETARQLIEAYPELFGGAA